MLCIASITLITSSLWSGLSVGWGLAFAGIPFLIHFLEQRRAQAWVAGRVLVIWPDKPWQLSFFSIEHGLTDSIEVIVVQRWHHLFGLSLRLKLQNLPQHKRQSTTVVVWRHGLNKSIFRNIARQAASQIEFAGLESKGGAA